MISNFCSGGVVGITSQAARVVDVAVCVVPRCGTSNVGLFVWVIYVQVCV